jgi:hypothetical protein
MAQKTAKSLVSKIKIKSPHPVRGEATDKSRASNGNKRVSLPLTRKCFFHFWQKNCANYARKTAQIEADQKIFAVISHR